MIKNFSKVKLHPLSYKALKSGHPWVIKDQFTKKFPKGSPFLLADNYFFLNDPDHPQIKARLWHVIRNEQGQEIAKNFWDHVKSRLERSFNKRQKMALESKRENYYLCFGEADQMPGLMIQKLGNAILVQVYCFFWDKEFKLLFRILKELLGLDVFYYKQIRKGNDSEIIALTHHAPKELTLIEFGMTYSIRMDQGHDIGIYSDMSAIREKIIPYLQKSESVLNLYAYTGAFSVQALSYAKTTSVDLSSKYLSWLEANIELNTQKKELKEHQSLAMPTRQALKKLEQQKESFDLIICDPPSFSSDGKKSSSAFDNYKQDLPLLFKTANNKGHLLICLNTHKIAPSKFRQLVESTLPKGQFEIVKSFKLSEDCPTMPSFKEGNYLKALLIKKL